MGKESEAKVEDAKKLKEEVDLLVQREVDELSRVLDAKDDLVPLVLRFHLLTEYQLERLILNKVPRGDRVLEGGGLTYYQKLMLVSSLEAAADNAVSALKALNKLRNRCSHDRDVQITLSHVESLGRPFGGEFIQLKAKHGKAVATLLKSTFVLIYTPLIHETVTIELLASRGESR